jgi:uncharacterized protein YbjT (DUF2867 family)
MQNLGRIVLVVGSTGRQGGNVAKHLLQGNTHIRALVRDVTCPAAVALAGLGVELIPGDLESSASLDRALNGVQAVFAVMPTEYSSGMQADFGYADEVRYGRNLASAAKRAGVQHYVYSSVANADRMKGLRNYAKREIEEHIQSIGLPATMVRPAWFMENFADPFFGVQNGSLALAIRPEVSLQLVCCADIGRLVELIFREGEQHLGRTYEIAGDCLRPPEIGAAISRAMNQEIPYIEIALDAVRAQSEEAFGAFAFMNRERGRADIAALRMFLPGLTDFETWLTTTGTASLEKLFANR